jgi:RNA polymerase sigma-70 factor (ECF subfamily)
LDAQLLTRCQAGDPKAIEGLVHEHEARLYRFCLSILDEPADADDATQESFIAALKALKAYRGDSAFQTWLFSIALNTCRTTLRQRKRRATLASSMSDPSISSTSGRQNPEREFMQQERAQILWQAISQLDEKHRLPIVLRYYDELSTHEIAEVLGISLGTVHSRLSIARTRLSGALKRGQSGKRSSK